MSLHSLFLYIYIFILWAGVNANGMCLMRGSTKTSHCKWHLYMQLYVGGSWAADWHLFIYFHSFLGVYRLTYYMTKSLVCVNSFTGINLHLLAVLASYRSVVIYMLKKTAAGRAPCASTCDLVFVAPLRNTWSIYYSVCNIYYKLEHSINL